MNANELAVLNASIGVVSAAIPEVGALIVGLKAIWIAANPGKSDADWVATVGNASGSLLSTADAQLTADGFVRDPVTGKWTHPPSAS